MTSTETAVRTLLDGYADAIRDKDIDRLMSHYSHGSVYFDLVAPLRFVGASERHAQGWA